MELEALRDEVNYKYLFIFPDRSTKEFVVRLNKKNLDLIHDDPIPQPDWAKLDSFRCYHCPLDSEKNEYCPIACNLIELFNFFKDFISHKQVVVHIETDERTIFKDTDLQSSISSLLGIYMSTSGCPVMDKLRPMARLHLPFATLEETVYRAVSMYLLAQYFKNVDGKDADWDLKNLIKIYDDVKIVNENFCDKLAHIDMKDAGLNAVVILDTFASYIPISIEQHLEDLKPLFKSYF